MFGYRVDHLSSTVWLSEYKMQTLLGEAGWSEQPDFALPMLLVACLFVGTGLAVYLLMQATAEVLIGARPVTIRLLLQAMALIAVLTVLFGVYEWLKEAE